MNIQDPKFLAQVEQAVREAGQIFYDRTKVSHMKHKGITDFVTEVDLSVQTFLKERLAQLAPEVQLRRRTTAAWTLKSPCGSWTRWTGP